MEPQIFQREIETWITEADKLGLSIEEYLELKGGDNE